MSSEAGNCFLGGIKNIAVTYLNPLNRLFLSAGEKSRKEEVSPFTILSSSTGESALRMRTEPPGNMKTTWNCSSRFPFLHLYDAISNRPMNCWKDIRENVYSLFMHQTTFAQTEIDTRPYSKITEAFVCGRMSQRPAGSHRHRMNKRVSIRPKTTPDNALNCPKIRDQVTLRRPSPSLPLSLPSFPRSQQHLFSRE